jgi:hypothetical protein
MRILLLRLLKLSKYLNWHETGALIEGRKRFRVDNFLIF